jgi:nucleotide-binding universal stress UspA family protein
MYRSLLVPLDGSEFAEQALPVASSLARRSGAVLHVARVYLPVAGVHGEHAMPYDEALDRELMKRAHSYLDEVVARLAAHSTIKARAALLEGSIADSISRHAAEIEADLLIMTTQGRGPLARFWLGSISDQLARKSSIPVLFVRPQDATPGFTWQPGVRRVLIPLDGSALAESILEPALALTEGGQVEYTLLQVLTPSAELSYGPAGGRTTGFQESLKQLKVMEQLQSGRARMYLEQQADRLRARSFVVSTRVILHDRPATAILEDASVHHADLIALGTHGRGGLKRLLLGSVADKVLRGANTLVLVYRPFDGSVLAE